jgi:hypothetical protein
MTVILISCVKDKSESSCFARDMYLSAWFKKARRHAESKSHKWFILSAKYGLLDPDESISPYEQSLNSMPSTERRSWARDVLCQIQSAIDNKSTIEILAGRRYREFLVPALIKNGYCVSVPLEGLGIGRQLQWFDKENINEG